LKQARRGAGDERTERGRQRPRERAPIDRNGPTSLPLGLMTPMVPASARIQRLPVDAKTSPAATIRIAPAISMRRRPMRSARVVSDSETMVSPTRIKVSSMPVCGSLRPMPTR